MVAIYVNTVPINNSEGINKSASDTGVDLGSRWNERGWECQQAWDTTGEPYSEKKVPWDLSWLQSGHWFNISFKKPSLSLFHLFRSVWWELLHLISQFKVKKMFLDFMNDMTEYIYNRKSACWKCGVYICKTSIRCTIKSVQTSLKSFIFLVFAG